MKQLYLIIFFLFLNLSLLLAQTTSTSPIPKWTVKYSPISLVDFFTPSIQFAAEQRIARRQSLEYEVGYLTNFDGRYINPNPLQGYRLRVGWRKYRQIDILKSENNPNKKWMRYWGLQMMWKQDFVDKEETFCRANCSYFQRIAYRTETSTIAAYWQLGWVYRVGRFRLDLGVAPGLRIISIKDKGIPDDARIADFNFGSIFNRRPGNDIAFPFFSAVLVLKVGYVLKEN